MVVYFSNATEIAKGQLPIIVDHSHLRTTASETEDSMDRTVITLSFLGVVY